MKYFKVSISDLNYEILKNSQNSDPHTLRRTVDGKQVLLTYRDNVGALDLFKLGYSPMNSDEWIIEKQKPEWLDDDIRPALINNYKPIETRIEEESIKTGGHFQTKSIIVIVPTTVGWYNHDISWPIPISLLSAEWIGKPENDGDEIQIHIAPDSIIGALTADAAINDKLFSVSQTVVDNVKVGYCISMGGQDLGIVINIDKDNLQITTEKPTTSILLASSPTYVLQTVRIIPHLELESAGRHQIGESKIGGSYLNAEIILRTRYNNKDGTNKKFIYLLEYLY